MRIVLDTNIWMSAIFWEGEASRIIEIAEKNKIDIFISEDIISEIINVLNKEAKFSKFLENKKQSINEVIRTILSIAKFLNPTSKLSVIKEHPSDNIILELALDCKAKCIISYNKHLLNIIEFRGMPIITPGEFIKRLEK